MTRALMVPSSVVPKKSFHHVVLADPGTSKGTPYFIINSQNTWMSDYRRPGFCLDSHRRAARGQPTAMQCTRTLLTMHEKYGVNSSIFSRTMNIKSDPLNASHSGTPNNHFGQRGEKKRKKKLIITDGEVKKKSACGLNLENRSDDHYP